MTSAQSSSPSLVPDREFHFTKANFDRVRELIYQHAGISLAPIKQDMVYSRLARRLRALKLSTFEEYLARLEQGDKDEWETFVNSLTTNLTAFFRESHHFDILKKQLQERTSRPLRIWCSCRQPGYNGFS